MWRLADCEGKPMHAHWTEYNNQIRQYCDDEDDCDWYPTLIGQYNETPSTSECRFVCNTDKGYVWNGDDCVGKTQIVNCGSVNDLPDDNMHWHYDQIVQQWVCNDTETSCDWDIETDAEYSEDPVENQCRYRCNEHYTWDGNSTCVANKQTVNCDDESLIDNTSWWNDSIEQTWDGNDWAPSNTGSYSKTAVDNECRFKCNDGYFWDGDSCENPCVGVTNPCSGVANSNGVCSATGPADYSCECNTGYYWWDNQGCINKKPLALGNICTGQTTCYNNWGEITCPAEGEDFYGQSSQYAANGTCVNRDFSLNDSVENEPTVFDNNTGLEWQKNFSTATLFSMNAAIDHCENLEYGGHSDWRLPTLYEMSTLLDYSQGKLASLNADTSYLWTSTFTSEDFGTWIWVPWYGTWDGSVNYGYALAVCVRGNEMPAAEFTVSEIAGDEIVKDNTTGLMWQKTTAYLSDYDTGLQDEPWLDDALSYCENLDYAGFSDWRLPNANELTSVIQAPNTLFGEESESRYFWSSDTKVEEESVAYIWGTSETLGMAPSYSYKSNYTGTYTNTRCVRSGFCGDDKFWNGSECVTPCNASSCGGDEHAVCVPKSYDSFVCTCNNADSGYFWSGTACVNPCDTASCADVQHSTHECIPTDWNTHVCGCESGYFYEGSQCIPITFGRICTGLNHCYGTSGQIDCPNQGEDFFGQDAQYAKLGFCAPRSLRIETISGDEVVIDDNLGLEWQKEPGSLSDWYDAEYYCEHLNYAGHGNWRLPTRKEFFSLRDPNASSSNYFLWTSEIPNDENYKDDMVYVSENSYSYSYAGKNNEYYVRCVSGNNTMPDADLRSSTVSAGGNSYEIVTDSTTRLIWQKNPGESQKTWKDALSYCENLNYAGLSNWRLPNSNEFYSLLDYDFEITGETWPYFWTSSSSVYGGEALDYSSANMTSMTVKQSVLCVHSDICEEDKFWNGSACVNPCDANPCGSGAEAECIPESYDSYKCECYNADAGYLWAGSECLPECGPGSDTPCYDPTSNLTWSNLHMQDSFYYAQDTCRDLSEGGLSGWRLPTISELRMLIQNCEGTKFPGGTCPVDDSHTNESYNYYSTCKSCSSDLQGSHNKFRDPIKVWSSTLVENTSNHWVVNFENAQVTYESLAGSCYYRCVRN